MDILDSTAYIEMIGNVGFPILITLILLRTILSGFNKRLDSLDKRLIQLNKTMTMIVKAIDQERIKENETQSKQHFRNDT